MSLLSLLLQAPNGGTQSFLEGVFNPGVEYDEITEGILGMLSNDDTSAMRRTNSTMNNYLTATVDDGTDRHRQEVMRDKCDVIGLNLRFPHLADPQNGRPAQPCPNAVRSVERLRRCTRGDRDPGYGRVRSRCHRGIENFLVCTACNQTLRNHPMIQDMKRVAMYDTHWAVCQVCTEAQERGYPNGARLCRCLAEIERRVLCYECMLEKFRYLANEGLRHLTMRKTIWRDRHGGLWESVFRLRCTLARESHGDLFGLQKVQHCSLSTSSLGLQRPAASPSSSNCSNAESDRNSSCC